jgi:signal peptidase I
MSIYIDLARYFGKFRFYENTLAALFPFFYFPYLGMKRKLSYLGPDSVREYKKSALREWIDAGVFAVVAATLIRTFVFESFAIPTGSMEKTLLVNDYLFASKLSYGPRLPNTPLAFPFVQNTLPVLNSKSYLEWIKIPYTRWFVHPVKRNDVVVFNFPEGDTTIDKEEYGTKVLYYDVIRSLGNGDPESGRKILLSDPEEYPLIVRPVDKLDLFVKRCVAVAGDTLQIREGILYVNGEKAFLPEHSQTVYYVETGGQPLDDQVLKEEYQVNMDNSEEFQTTDKANVYRMLLTNDALEKMKKSGLAKNIRSEIYPNSLAPAFPFDSKHPWSFDQFGPLWVPRKGRTVLLNEDNYSLYERIIRTYEGNKLFRRDGKIFINDRATNLYTFKMDYFWMMGDNRHNSLDSRDWGFVPEDHIVGKASTIFMSWDKGLRWERIFKQIY